MRSSGAGLKQVCMHSGMAHVDERERRRRDEKPRSSSSQGIGADPAAAAWGKRRRKKGEPGAPSSLAPFLKDCSEHVPHFQTLEPER